MIALLGKTATVEVNPTLTLPATGKNKTKQQQTLSLIFHILAVFILALHAPGSDPLYEVMRVGDAVSKATVFKG